MDTWTPPEPPFKNVDFQHLKYNEENVWVGKTAFKFYHDQRCPNCNYCSVGYNDLRSEGPWNFTCVSCHYEWSVSMLTDAKENRRKILRILKDIDRKIGEALAIERRYVKR